MDKHEVNKKKLSDPDPDLDSGPEIEDLDRRFRFKMHIDRFDRSNPIVWIVWIDCLVNKYFTNFNLKTLEELQEMLIEMQTNRTIIQPV
ncbi:hypothetical protein M0802_012298 [Mischocyttarus mexicanus]|nr:hypothetical protein M0802_012298 [Mischocyttarus mexicanus]